MYDRKYLACSIQQQLKKQVAHFIEQYTFV